METHSAAHLRHRLEEIDTETASLHAIIAELAAARRVVVEQLKRVTYPVLRLPVEITCKIFLEYTQDEAIDVASLDELNGPSVLASVCRQWRAIALRQRELWTRIFFNGCSTLTQAKERLGLCLERLGLCLERAGTLAGLDLEFDDDDAQRDLLPLLLPTASQWSRLGMFVDDEEHLGDHIRGRLTRLRVLTLHVYNWDDASPIVAFQDTPMLREVQLFGVDARVVSLPWAQLSTLTLHGSRYHCDASCYLAMLQQTHNLETLHLFIPKGNLPSDGAILELRLERLRKLTFKWSSNGQAASRMTIAFANLLTVPALVDLTTDIDEGRDCANALTNMLTRSRRGENMRSLTLKLHGGHPGYIHLILSGLACLDTLTLAQVEWNQLDALLHVLEYPTQPLKIGHLSIEMVPRIIPYLHFLGLVNETHDKNRLELRRFEFSIPPYAHRSPEELEVEQSELLSAVEWLRRIAASPDGPEISIGPGAHNNSLVISSTAGLPVRLLLSCCFIVLTLYGATSPHPFREYRLGREHSIG
ncbi:hypothetical protein C8F01DRAFT_1232463 [Mycena amicta]|nr:hypothetical protein C8F01DRAFT_1232463 [Mycena amicta]